MPLADDCVFCRILKGEIPCTKVYEDDMVLAFLDIAPFNPGHTVIVPKEHQHSSTAIDVEYLKAIIAVAPKIGAALMRATGAEGFNIFQNNGRVAGQTVPHVHFHVVPRFADDGVQITGSTKKYGDFAEMNALADKVKANLKL